MSKLTKQETKQLN